MIWLSGLLTPLPSDYPVEYIDWKVNFFGRDFIVTPDVLIPRLETESLVRRARKLLWSRTKNQELRTIIDIGCGSGIIGTSVADLADEVIFLDISPAALRVAEQNFRTYFPEKQAQFIISDLLSNLQIPTTNSQLLFLTNLPYIRADDWENMSADTVHEPRLALFGGETTGFELYERLFDQIIQLPTSNFQLLFEFGFDQRVIAENHLKTKYPQWEYSFFADYAGVERFGEVYLI